MRASPNPYRGFRFPAEIIEQAVWLYHCFSLSLRDVELILAARGVAISYETIRDWSIRFGRLFALGLKRRRPRPGDKWFMDEVFIRIRGKLHYLWRAVDQNGTVLDILVQSRRDASAAKRFFRRLLKAMPGTPRVIVTDKLRSYAAARRDIMPRVAQQSSGSIAPTDPPTRTADAAVQIRQTGTALSVQSQSDPQSLPTSPSSRICH
jgi:putative transposase